MMKINLSSSSALEKLRSDAIGTIKRGGVNGLRGAGSKVKITPIFYFLSFTFVCSNLLQPFGAKGNAMTARLGIAAIAAIALFASACTESKVDVAMMQRVANELNRSLPAMQDEDTRLDEVVVGPGLAWTYKFTLVNVDYSPDLMETVKRDYVPEMIKIFCSDPATQIFLEENIATRILHVDRTGEIVSSVVLNREACFVGGV